MYFFSWSLFGANVYSITNHHVSNVCSDEVMMIDLLQLQSSQG